MWKSCICYCLQSLVSFLAVFCSSSILEGCLKCNCTLPMHQGSYRRSSVDATSHGILGPNLLQVSQQVNLFLGAAFFEFPDLFLVLGGVRRLSNSGLQFKGNILSLLFFPTCFLLRNQRDYRKQMTSLLDSWNLCLNAQHLFLLLDLDLPKELLE